MFLSIFGGSRSMGGGEVWEECREQGLLFPLAFGLLFSVFLSLRVEIRCHCSCVCLVFEPQSKRVNRFVCFDDCQQTSGWKCSTSPVSCSAEGHDE